ncbi:MAG: DUF4373 domain-containing protein [Ignavibacteriaceae bacterium]|nr:DUF4373 domain-containing protein [Ignavibacteriaceae bacterium]
MARPIKNGLDYFPHDTDAFNDWKIQALRATHGNNGYAFYFITLEHIYKTANGELDISDQVMENLLIKATGLKPFKFKAILETALKLSLFNENRFKSGKILTSDVIKLRFDAINEKRAKYREIKEKRDLGNSFPLRKPHKKTPQETPPETPQSKVKERKANTKQKKKLKNEYSKDFLQAYKDYNFKAGNKFEAFQIWQECNDTERIMILENIPDYVKATKTDYEDTSDSRPGRKHFSNYLKMRQYENPAPPPLKITHGTQSPSPVNEDFNFVN